MNKKERSREQMRKWRAANPDKVKANQKRDDAKRKGKRGDYYLANKEKIDADNAAWDKAHPGAAAERQKRYREKHPERNVISSRAVDKKRGATKEYKVMKWARRQAQKIIPQEPICCERCNQIVSIENVERHHPDHRFTEEIIWLCDPCHILVEKELFDTREERYKLYREFYDEHPEIFLKGRI